MKFYSTQQAADYLEIQPETIKKHYQQGHLHGTLVGHSMIYTQEDLDAFKATWKRTKGPAPNPNSIRSQRRKRKAEREQG